MYHIGGGDYRHKETPLFVCFQILKLTDLFKFETAKFMHKFMHTKLPSKFTVYFIKTLNISTRTTRASSNNNNPCIPKFPSTRLQRYIKYQAVKT